MTRAVRKYAGAIFIIFFRYRHRRRCSLYWCDFINGYELEHLYVRVCTRGKQQVSSAHGCRDPWRWHKFSYINAQG